MNYRFFLGVLLTFAVVLTATIGLSIENTDIQTVALVKVTAGPGVEEAIANSMKGRVLSEIQGKYAGKYALVDQANLNQVLEIQAQNQSEACDDKCQVLAIGAMLQVRYILVGEINHVGNRYELVLHRTDVGTGQEVGIGRMECACSASDALQMTPDVVAMAFGEKASGPSKQEVFGMSSTLALTGYPAGALVFVDNQSKGIFPESGDLNLSLPAGTYHLVVNSSTGAVLLDRPVNLKPNTTIELPKTAGPETSQPKTSGGKTTTLAIASYYTDPSGNRRAEDGAKIALDGRDTGKITPASLMSVEPGSHTISLDKPQFHKTTVTVQLKPGDVMTKDVDLTPAFGRLSIESVPPKASVLIDGKEVGRTPAYFDRYDSGTHDVELRLAEYHDYKEKVVIGDGQNVERRFELRPSFAVLSVELEPKSAAGAQVTWGPFGLGQAPFKDLRVTAGKYVLRVRHEKFFESAQEIELVEGERRTIAVKLVTSVGYLTVESDPCSGKVYIDNRELGSTPFSTDTIKGGDHLLKIVPNDARYQVLQETFKLPRDGTLTVRKTFAPITTDLVISTTPIGATVILDRKTQDKKTPARFEGVIIGPHTLRLEVPGKAPVERSIDLEDKPENNLDITFSNKGSLRVTSSPVGASISLNEKYQPRQTPATISELDKGTYAVTISRDQYTSETRMVEIHDGEVAVVNVSLTLAAQKEMNEEGGGFFSLSGIAFLPGSGTRVSMKNREKDTEEVLPPKMQVKESDLGNLIEGGMAELAMRVKHFHLGFLGGYAGYTKAPKDASGEFGFFGGFIGYSYRWGRLGVFADGVVMTMEDTLIVTTPQGKSIRYTGTRIGYFPRGRLVLNLMGDPFAKKYWFAALDLMTDLSNVPMAGGGVGLGRAF